MEIDNGERQLDVDSRHYLRLREEILNRDIAPGEVLLETAISARYGVSRTPIREAVTRLVADGLLQREDYGYSVVVPSMSRVLDLYEVRIAVELRGISRSIENPQVRHDADQLGAELERWYGLRVDPPEPSPEFVLEDEQFHAELLGSSGNSELVAVLVDVNRRIRRVRMYDFTIPGRIETSIDEHIEIAERVLENDLVTAHRKLHEHIGASLEIVVERANRAIAAMNARAAELPIYLGS